jgi:hypothetical protein
MLILPIEFLGSKILKIPQLFGYLYTFVSQMVEDGMQDIIRTTREA